MNLLLEWARWLYQALRRLVGLGPAIYHFEIDFKTGGRFKDVQVLFPLWEDYTYFIDRGLLRLSLSKDGETILYGKELVPVLRRLRVSKLLYENVDLRQYTLPDGTLTEDPEDVPPHDRISRIQLSGELPAAIVEPILESK